MQAPQNPSLRVACIQMRSTTDIAKNVETLRTLVNQAADQGANYVQTPEMTGILQRNPKLLFASITEHAQDQVFQTAAQLAQSHGIWVHIGSTAIALGNSKAANRGALFGPQGEEIAIYDKIHMFDVDLDGGERWRESKVYEPGNQCVLSSVNQVKTGLAICYDLRFPHLFRHQAKQGAILLTCPSSFTRQTGEAHWHTLLKSRAIENGAFMVAAAQGGKHDDGRETYGHSIVIDPWGNVVAELEHDEPGVLTADLDLSLVDQARKKIPSLANERRFSIRDQATEGFRNKGEVA